MARRSSYQTFKEKRAEKYCSRTGTKRRHNEKLNKLRVEIDFAHSLQAYMPAAWKTQPENLVPETSSIRHLMSLPPELRTMIYEYALTKPGSITLYQQQYNQRHQKRFVLSRGPRISHTSRQIRREAIPIYFKANNFVLQTQLIAINHAASWIGRIVNLCGRNPFGGLRFQMQHCPWAEFHRIESLVQLLASGALKLDVSGLNLSAALLPSGSSQSCRLFMIDDMQGSAYLQRALEEAVFIGSLAFEQGWSLERVSRQFDVLMALKMPLNRLAVYTEKKKLREEKAVREQWTRS